MTEEESEMSMYKPSLSHKTEELAKKRRGDCDVHSRLNETKVENIEQSFRKPAGGDEDLRFNP